MHIFVFIAVCIGCCWRSQVLFHKSAVYGRGCRGRVGALNLSVGTVVGAVGAVQIIEELLYINFLVNGPYGLYSLYHGPYNQIHGPYTAPTTPNEKTAF